MHLILSYVIMRELLISTPAYSATIHQPNRQHLSALIFKISDAGLDPALQIYRVANMNGQFNML